MNSVLATLNWACDQNWLVSVPRIKKVKTSKNKLMKGRPINENEFQTMLDEVSNVVGEESAVSWKYVLRGLWNSALRLNEIMHVSWDVPDTIIPIWESGKLPILEFPDHLQKNNTREHIPMIPWFETLLLETPENKRTGWVFNPGSLQGTIGRKSGDNRLKTDWVGKVISRIGKKAGIVVQQQNERTGTPAKYASAHDMRRSCAERLRNAGVPPLVICKVMRHSSWETTRKHYAPGETQREAESLQSILKKEHE